MIDLINKKHLLKISSRKIKIINEEVYENELSVVLITYNHVDYIERSIQSILSQTTNFRFELLIGDDQSTDGTTEICKKYAKLYPKTVKLYLHQRENSIKILGTPCGIFQIAFNLMEANGRFIAICSGDDIWQDENKLQTQYDYLMNNSDVSLVYTPFTSASLNGSKKNRVDFPKASTMCFRNIANEIPTNFLNVIQEDVFLWFILRQRGRFQCLDNLRPVLINEPPSSITRQFDSTIQLLHILNVYRQLYLAYKKSEYNVRCEATYRYFLTLFKFRNVRSIKNNIIRGFVEIGLWRLVQVSVWRIINWNKRLSWK